MNYLEIFAKSYAQNNVEDILTAFLADFGCESFSEVKKLNEVYGYIPEPLFHIDNFNRLKENSVFNELSYQKVIEKDWNAIWESNYPSVIVDEQCYIRAPFHPANTSYPYEIIIEPKMSFGTANHETTASMISLILESNLHQKSVLDMGAGTGVLAILAAKKGAEKIVAVDNDQWAYENNMENNLKNNIQNIEVILGDATILGQETFDVIFANINRNILLHDMASYVKVLNPKGSIFFSGFYENPDLSIIEKEASDLGLSYQKKKVKNNWCAAQFIRI